MESKIAMKNKEQKQEATNGSSAIQAGGDVNITNAGLTYSEVKEVALDVFRANFYELAGLAKQTARDRAEEITEDFLSKLQSENPSGFQKSQDPDFQYALFTVQKEYARTGDKELGDLLIDLLVDRSKLEQRDILQIVLNESLSTAPKLTDSQLAVLSVTFLFKYTQNLSLGNHELFGNYLDHHVFPFASKLVKNQASYQHLQFSGCGSIGMGQIALETIFSKTYQGLFSKGFNPEEINKRDIDGNLYHRFFVPCLNAPSKLQVKAINKESLTKVLDNADVNDENRKKIEALFDTGKMDESEIRNKCIEIRPYMAEIFDVWSASQLKHFTLTSVGIAIGHANIKRLVGEFANLRIWIN